LNAVEIEEAVSELFEQSFDTVTFPGAFLESFGNKPTVIKRLQSAASLSDIEGAVLQRNNIHFKVCPEGQVNSVFNQLKNSPATAKNKAKFILATDGVTIEAEDLNGDAPLVCDYKDFPNHFGYFLPLAGIEIVKQIRDSSFDIRATSRLNRLYIELLKDNPEWGTADNRHEMNHFMARLIFCFFAEDTDIIRGERLFTTTIEQMSERDSSNTNQIISQIFRSLNTKIADRASEKLPRWTEQFPYVNGGLFSGKVDVPRFSKIARSYLLHIGGLDWTKINPDIFGSMIQAVADDEERGSLGMHYTSVPNILKVLNPLFLDDLRGQLEAAGDNARSLLNLKKRIAKIRVFDPACGSGNFLVIAYKQMREIENEINVRRDEVGSKTDIPLTNFRGIELRDFPAEIARLALIIAEYQCDLMYRGQKKALDDFLPLDSQNWITCANALRLDWLSICPPTGTGVKIIGSDLFEVPVEQSEIDFENEGGETYICGNPPYRGVNRQSTEQKEDLRIVFEGHIKNWKSLDYVAGWFMKASEYGKFAIGGSALVATNSICQGHHVPNLWPLIFSTGYQITFAHTSFKWANLASHNAGVSVVIVGFSKQRNKSCKLFSVGSDGADIVKQVDFINAYLVAGPNVIVDKSTNPLADLAVMDFGNHPYYAMELILSRSEAVQMQERDNRVSSYLRPFYGSQEVIDSAPRYCLWISDNAAEIASTIDGIKERLDIVVAARLAAKRDKTAQILSKTPYRFREMREAKTHTIVIPIVSSESRAYLPIGLLRRECVVSYLAFALYDAPLYNFALLASKIHLVWVATVCSKLETRYRYSNTIGWNTFPLPVLTEKNKADLTKSAEGILLARESHFPATIAELYETDSMPKNLRDAHERNDEVLERIYIGRRFKNDTERLEKLFELYTKMTSKK
jgi:hypothetical protein